MHSLIHRLSFSNVAAAIALFAAIGGGVAIGLPGRNSVTSDDIRRGAVRVSDIAKNAVNGRHVRENTLSKVPRAGLADSATTAGDADTLDGINSLSFQLGNGIDVSVAEFINNSSTETVINLLDHRIDASCATGTPSYEVFDASDGAAPTDVWFEGSPHEEISGDGDGSTAVPAPSDGSLHVSTWGGAQVISSVHLSSYAVGDNCVVVASAQATINLNAPGRSAGGGSRARTADIADLRRAIRGG